jgi:hypothetical protein
MRAKVEITRELKDELQKFVIESKDMFTIPKYWSVDKPSAYGGVTIRDMTIRLAEDETSKEDRVQKSLEDFFFSPDD